MRTLFVLAAFSLVFARPAVAQEAAVYTYDLLGRLTQVTETQANKPPVITLYEYDKSGNRLKQQITGSQAGTILILPMLGNVIIPLP